MNQIAVPWNEAVETRLLSDLQDSNARPCVSITSCIMCWSFSVSQWLDICRHIVLPSALHNSACPSLLLLLLLLLCTFRNALVILFVCIIYMRPLPAFSLE